ncbi:HAD-IIB family hydrolase [Pseudooceanicola sp. LIPI14-2-Ac024]|uniref:HAD-IIB family hydrolase n=1 Tax=Pseudooceanicola sp. LIPI14-2-Ac024 TaxID=3344875 RepID=UPI0035CFBB4F
MSNPPFVVFSDLDGTLLDHEDYSWAPALPALSKLRAVGAPVVLASSKTAPEIAPIRDQMRLTQYPAIVENGAGLLPPGTSPRADNSAYLHLREILDGVKPGLRRHFQGFGDWSDEEVAEQTGLPLENARLARRRAFSEPGIWTGPAEMRDLFLTALAEEGVTARRGGRYLTLSFGGTKADRMEMILQAYGTDDTLPVSIALGDAPNDVEMLNAADHGIIIANSFGAELPILAGERAGRIRRSTKEGPAGWNEMILALVSELTARNGS